MTKTVLRYTDVSDDGWMQWPTGEFVSYEDYVKLEGAWHAEYEGTQKLVAEVDKMRRVFWKIWAAQASDMPAYLWDEMKPFVPEHSPVEPEMPG